jgi:hypothetical protein
MPDSTILTCGHSRHPGARGFPALSRSTPDTRTSPIYSFPTDAERHRSHTSRVNSVRMARSDSSMSRSHYSASLVTLVRGVVSRTGIVNSIRRLVVG